MDPTRADIIAKTAVSGWPLRSSAFSMCGVFFLGRKGEKCLSMSMGPSVFVWNVSRASAALIWLGDFSGKSRPGTMNESWRGSGEGDVNFFLHSAAASSIVDSSRMFGLVSCGGAVWWRVIDRYLRHQV